MITLTETIIRETYQTEIPRFKAELLKPWESVANAVKGGNLNPAVDSSFNIGLIERLQQKAVGIAGIAIWKQLPIKSSYQLAKWQSDVQWAMRNHNLQFVQGIDEMTSKKIGDALQDAVAKHQTPDEIAKAILDKGVQMSESRARRIAVTEGTRGAAIGVLLAANDFPWLCKKHWVHTGDERVRLRPMSHRIPFDEGKWLHEPWFNGEWIQFPGDPQASPNNTINCRCMLALVAVRDTQGNLVPKRVKTTGQQLLGGFLSGAIGSAIFRLLDSIFNDDEG